MPFAVFIGGTVLLLVMVIVAGTRIKTGSGARKPDGTPANLSSGHLPPPFPDAFGDPEEYSNQVEGG